MAEALPDAVEQGYLQLLDEVYRTGKPYSASGSRYAFQASPGEPATERYVDFVYQPITGNDGAVRGILVQGADVTSRAIADQALALNRARLDYATRLSGIGFWYCDLPFDELEWDTRVKEHFFFAPDDRITIDDFYARIHEDDRLATRAAIEKSIRDRAAYDIVYRTVHPSTGETKWIRALGGTDYAADGSPTHFDGVTVDVSAQTRDQQDLARLNRRLRDQDRRKDEFIAMLSHELRNPLAPIRAAAKVVATPNVDPSHLSQSQRIIERQVGHMALLLDDLLDIARITEGKLQLRKETLPLIPMIDAAVEAVRPKLNAKNQHLEIRLPDEQVWLEVDHLRLSQILSNLLTNAAKYSDAGSHIELAAAMREHTLTLSVKDDGIGIAPNPSPRYSTCSRRSKASKVDRKAAWDSVLRWSRASPNFKAARSRHAALVLVMEANSCSACRSLSHRRLRCRRQMRRRDNQPSLAGFSLRTTTTTLPKAWPCSSSSAATPSERRTSAARRCHWRKPSDPILCCWTLACPT